MPPVPPDAEEIERRIKAATEGSPPLTERETIEQAEAAENRKSRRIVMMVAMGAWLSLMLIVSIGQFGPDDGRLRLSKEGTAVVLELIKVAALPIVTLVLGYYFGSRR